MTGHLFNIVNPEEPSAELVAKVRTLEHHVTFDGADVEIQEEEGRLHLYPSGDVMVLADSMVVCSTGKDGVDRNVTTSPTIESRVYQWFLGLKVTIGDTPYTLHRVKSVPMMQPPHANTDASSSSEVTPTF